MLPAIDSAHASRRVKITDVTAELYAKPYDTPISNGKYTYTASKNVVVRISTDDGLEGFRNLRRGRHRGNRAG